ncbi:hypothetical protein BDD12DRAFT_110326 [Trichophaea hybrida]|nr:hypothetical protein BDD12DRAFT_110326 [Trichophaea hybrida]
MATVCRYFQQGSCHYGNQCKFLHPGQPTKGGNNGSGLGLATTTAQPKTDNYLAATVDSLSVDLTEKPMWILSSYGPGKSPPCQLIDGKDVSYEEARVMAYQCQVEGNFAVYEQKWIQLNIEAESQIRNILSNLPGAINFMTEAQENRANIYRYKQRNSDVNASSPAFVQSQQQNSNPFGAPAPATQPNLFGQLSFGQVSQQTSAFGAPSPFAAAASATQSVQPAFGQSTFGQISTHQSAFSKPSQPAFGQSAFGQTSTSQSVFGKPAFGQPAFGQSAFAQPQQQLQQQQQSAFGTGGAFRGVHSKPAFGQPAFGQPAFGQTASLSANTPSPFATAVQTQSQPTVSPFGGFSQLQQQGGTTNPNPFGQPLQMQNNASPFSQANPFQQSQQIQPTTTNPFAQTPPVAPQQQTVTSPFNNPPQQPQEPQQNTPSSFSNVNLFQTAQQPQPQSPATASGSNQSGQSATPNRKEGKWDDPVIEYTQQELEAFKAPVFIMGMIPVVAPPRELCV